MTPVAEVNPFLLYSSVILFFAGVGAFAFWWSRREQAARDRFCKAHGLEFDEDGGPVDIPRSFEVMKRCPAGATPHIFHAMHRGCGAGAVGVATIGYYSTSNPGSHARTYRVLVGFLHHPDLDMPHFTVSPRTWRDQLWCVCRKQEIEVGDAAFRRKLVVRGTRPDEIRAFLTTPLRTAILQTRFVHVEGSKQTLVIYRRVGMFQLQRFDAWLASAFLGVLDGIVRCLHRDPADRSKANAY